MKTSHILLLILLGAGPIAMQAQDTPAPAPPADPAPPTEPTQTEMQKWIATTDAQWQAVFNREVTDVHAPEVKGLALKYAAALDVGIAKVSATGDLKGTVVLRDEKKRFAETNVFPEKDEDSDSASVKAIRASIRVQLARLETANATRAKAVHAKYDAVFAQAQTQLTQRQRFDDALLVQAKRDEVKAAWITPAIAAAAEKANALAPAPAQPAIPLKVAAKQTPAPAKGVANDDDVTKALVGTWHLHWAEPGYDADYVFRADGTFTGRPVLRSGKEHNGTWKVTGNKIQMEAPKTGQKTIHLPIDPMGTNIFDHYKDWHILAVKKK